ncbi:MAG: hypothetical protein WC967_14745 [Balneolaceae bacterium]
MSSLLLEQHNKKTLAARYGITRKQMYKKLSIMLSDNKVSKEFGRYSYPFTTKQLQIIIDNIGEPPEK